MDHAPAPATWVERAVVEMRRSPEYRNRIADEWYETLPVPAWNAERNWLVVGFGENTRSAGPASVPHSRLPHVTCVLSYPDGKQHWTVDNTAERLWPGPGGPPDAVITSPVAGSLMDRRRRYYGSLSQALQAGAFSSHVPVKPAAACAAAAEARAAFLPAATYPNLAQVYAGAVHNMDGWLATHCAKP